MKKYLSIVCALLTLTAFVSCGDSNSSDDSSKVSESSISETTAEETTEATTEKETETTTQKQVYDLDSVIDFGIVSLSIPSSFDIAYKSESEHNASLTISLTDGKKHEIIFHFYKDPKGYKNEKFNQNNVTDTFTINGNECMVDPDAYIPTTIFFTNEIASGRIHYNDEDEELVKKIIETIKFNETEPAMEKSTQFSEISQSESTDKEPATEKVTEKPTEPPKSENVGSNEAFKSAKSYIDMSGFSYEELISQLEYEGFTYEEAVSAADSCGADWNAEALESAKSYIEMSGFSYTSLISQLEYEKFTHEQAVYGADNCGADWNQQAADSARSYLDTMSMSREELLGQLLYEGFTQEQAEFGLQAVGY